MAPTNLATNVFYLGQADFASGTKKLDKPGRYVFTEDVVFDLLDPATFPDNDALAGHTVALMVCSDDVVVDLANYTLRQSLRHYFDQRFFTLVQLGNAMFVGSQGPGFKDRPDASEFRAARRVTIMNGTLGLTSHMGIHGTNNDQIVLHNLDVVDYEVCGVQLNGVRGLNARNVRLRSVQCTPINFATNSLVLHRRRLIRLGLDGSDASPELSTAVGDGVQDMLVDSGGDDDADRLGVVLASGNDSILKALDTYSKLLDAFAQHEHLAAGAEGDVEAALRSVHVHLQALAATPDGASVARFVNPSGLPDGSALVGILLHPTGVAIHAVGGTAAATSDASTTAATVASGCCPYREYGTAATASAAAAAIASAPMCAPRTPHTCPRYRLRHCCANGQGSQSAGATSGSGSDLRPWSSVHLNDILVEDQALHSHETLAVLLPTVDTTDEEPARAMLRDISGAVWDLRRLRGANDDTHWFEIIRLLLLVVSPNMDGTGAPALNIDAVALRALFDLVTAADPVAAARADARVGLRANIDIMAHVAKGIFAIRAEGGRQLCASNVCIQAMRNTSTIVSPESLLDVTVGSTRVDYGANLLAAAEHRCFGGADAYGVFLSDVHNSRVQNVVANHVHTSWGLFHLILLFTCSNVVGSALTAGDDVDALVIRVFRALHTIRSRASDVVCNSTLPMPLFQRLLMPDECTESDAGEDAAAVATRRFNCLTRLVRNTSQCETISGQGSNGKGHAYMVP